MIKNRMKHDEGMDDPDCEYEEFKDAFKSIILLISITIVAMVIAGILKI